MHGRPFSRISTCPRRVEILDFFPTLALRDRYRHFCDVIFRCGATFRFSACFLYSGTCPSRNENTPALAPNLAKMRLENQTSALTLNPARAEFQYTSPYPHLHVVEPPRQVSHLCSPKNGCRPPVRRPPASTFAPSVLKKSLRALTPTLLTAIKGQHRPKTTFLQSPNL